RGLGISGGLEQAVQCPVQGHAQQVLFAADMVVDRGLRDTESLRQVFHAGPVMPASVDDGDAHGRRGLQVVAGTARAAMGRPAGSPPACSASTRNARALAVRASTHVRKATWPAGTRVTARPAGPATDRSA